MMLAWWNVSYNCIIIYGQYNYFISEGCTWPCLTSPAIASHNAKCQASLPQCVLRSTASNCKQSTFFVLTAQTKSYSPIIVRGCESGIDGPIVFSTLQVKVLPTMSASGWLMVSTF